ncbi:MAG: sugar ABC transporter ATP-binding protein [Arcanobacterium sp.]|nr:sugar ABC transporter ATP-binding protein [Arcanobacterium sp.]
MPEYILEMNSITKEFSGVKALDDVKLKVRKGEVHAICGENGAGKSTLMNVLSGVYPHGTYKGDIVYEGKVRSFSGVVDSEKLGIAIIHQELALSPYLSVMENIFIGDEITKNGFIDWGKTRRRALLYTAKVGLEVNPATPVIQLGVGQQQLVEIARALSKNVSLLILDEPTAALNDDDSEHLLELMKQLRDEGTTMIIISHKLNEIKKIADTTTVIRDGKTIQTLDMHRPGGVSEEELISLMVGRELSSRFPEHLSRKGNPILEIKDWTVYHPIDTKRAVVKRANLTLCRGEIVGLAGLMGAGRTELAMSVFGKQYGSHISGSVLKEGKEISMKTVHDAIKNGLAYVPEDRKTMGLNLIQTIKINMTAAALGKILRHGFISFPLEEQMAKEYKKKLRLKASSLDSPVASLSGGNQQKVVLAKWMYTDPQVLILDEPTRGIDVGAKYEIYQIIDELADAGCAILMISSELPELLGVCDRIYAMSSGRITGLVDAKEATQESLMSLMTVEEK